MKCFKPYGHLYRSSPNITFYYHSSYRSLILPSISTTNSSRKYQSNVITTCHQKRRFADDNTSSSSSSSTSPPSNSEERLKQAFISKYASKIKSSSTSTAWNRYEQEIKSDQPMADPDKVEDPKSVFFEGFANDKYETPKEKVYDPHKVMGIPRATFRGLVIGISCLIGATLFVILKPHPISEEKERKNMHYFAKLNADPNIHVTYSGLMYRIIEQTDLESEETDINLLTNPNPDIHVVNMDYEGRFVDGTVFDTTFEGQVENGCVFPAKSLIPGLHQGLMNMTRESEFEFYLPPHLAYGERGSEFIPPHEPLVFRVKLNDFWKDQDLDKPRKLKIMN